MSINLVSKGERLALKVGDSTVYYRRLSMAEQKRIQRLHTQKGKTDYQTAAAAMVREAVLGWENVTLDGEQVEYDPELLDLLPLDVQTELVHRLNEATAEEAKQLGN